MRRCRGFFSATADFCFGLRFTPISQGRCITRFLLCFNLWFMNSFRFPMSDNAMACSLVYMGSKYVGSLES